MLPSTSFADRAKRHTPPHALTAGLPFPRVTLPTKKRQALKKELQVDIHIDTVTNVLRRTALFRGLDESTLRSVASDGKLIQFQPGEALVEVGDPSDGLYVILRGQARVLAPLGPKKQLVDIGRMAPGEIIGEMGVLLSNERSATVDAVDTALVAMKYTTDVVA